MLRRMIWRRTERCEGLVRYYADTAKLYYWLSILFKTSIIAYSATTRRSLTETLSTFQRSQS